MDEPVTRRKALILLALGILTLLVVGVGGPLWTAHNEQLTRPVTALGTVTNASGKRLAAINVQVFRWQGHEWDAVDAVDTNEAGYFRFAGLEAGKYTVAFQDDSGAGYLVSWWGGGLSGDAGSCRAVSSLCPELVLRPLSSSKGRSELLHPDERQHGPDARA